MASFRRLLSEEVPNLVLFTADTDSTISYDRQQILKIVDEKDEVLNCVIVNVTVNPEIKESLDLKETPCYMLISKPDSLEKKIYGSFPSSDIVEKISNFIKK